MPWVSFLPYPNEEDMHRELFIESFTGFIYQSGSLAENLKPSKSGVLPSSTIEWKLSMMIYRDTDKAKMGYDDQLNSTYLQMKQALTEEEVINAHQEFITMITSLNISTGKHLSDARALVGLSEHSREWIKKVIIPFIKEKSKQDRASIALLVNDELLNDLKVVDMQSRVTADAETAFFKDEHSAWDWLSQH